MFIVLGWDWWECICRDCTWLGVGGGLIGDDYLLRRRKWNWFYWLWNTGLVLDHRICLWLLFLCDWDRDGWMYLSIVRYSLDRIELLLFRAFLFFLFYGLINGNLWKCVCLVGVVVVRIGFSFLFDLKGSLIDWIEEGLFILWLFLKIIRRELFCIINFDSNLESN